MGEDRVLHLHDAKGNVVQTVRAQEDDKGRVWISQHDSEGNLQGTLRYPCVGGNTDTVDVLDSDGKVVDTLCCDEDTERQTPTSWMRSLIQRLTKKKPSASRNG